MDGCSAVKLAGTAGWRDDPWPSLDAAELVKLRLLSGPDSCRTGLAGLGERSAEPPGPLSELLLPPPSSDEPAGSYCDAHSAERRPGTTVPSGQSLSPFRPKTGRLHSDELHVWEVRAGGMVERQHACGALP